MSGPNYKMCFNGCYESIDYGHDWSTFLKNMRLHSFICPVSYLRPHYIDAVETIQEAWRNFIERKRNHASQTIQQAILPWLYRPGGPMMKKAERRFYSRTLLL